MRLFGRSISELLKLGFRETTIRGLRNDAPFSRIDQTPASQEIPQLEGVSEAIRAYQRSADFFTSEFALRYNDRALYNGAPNELRLFVWKYMWALRRRGLPFYVHTCYRTPELQKKLRKQGNSFLSSGPHQRACAVDIVSMIDHWDIPQPLWDYVGSLGRQVAEGLNLGTGLNGKPLKVTWGGDWDHDLVPVHKDEDERFWDPAHWQLSDWRQRPIQDLDGAPVHLSPYSDAMRFTGAGS